MSLERYTRLLMDTSSAFPIHFLKIYSTVLDPRHPLCSQTLPLVAIIHHTQLGRCRVVWLRPHVERLVPVQATNLEFDPNDISPSPLSLAAVEQLLRVFQDI